MIPAKISLSKYVYQIKQRKELPYRVMLVNGTPFDRVSMFNTIYRLGQGDWDMLAVRLTGEITEQECGFAARLMRKLAEEVNLKANITGQLANVVSEYLNPFEISEKTQTLGISWKFSFGGAKKFLRKEKFPEEIRRDYISCFDWIRDLGWKTTLIIDSVEKLSTSSESFLIDFLDRHGEGSMTVLGGPSESMLGSFIRDQGISKHLESAFIIPEVKDEQTCKDNEGSTPSIPVDVFELSGFVVNAFATESIKFNYLKFDVWHQLGRSDFADNDLNFDLCLLGHLRMREDYPRLIRTDYDCAVIIKVLDDPVTNMSTVSTLTNAASRILINGVSTMKCVRFDPWDSFIFLATPSISKVILDKYEHLPYRNLFILLPDGIFHNLSPHKWMDHILNNISQRWSAL